MHHAADGKTTTTKPSGDDVYSWNNDFPLSRSDHQLVIMTVNFGPMHLGTWLIYEWLWHASAKHVSHALPSKSGPSTFSQ